MLACGKHVNEDGSPCANMRWKVLATLAETVLKTFLCQVAESPSRRVAESPSRRVPHMRPLPILCLLAAAPALAQTVDPSYYSALRWRSIGPPRSGYISAPAGVPGDPTTYYAGMPAGGVWKTTNGGNTWKPIFDSVHVQSVGAVAVAPSQPNVVYVGTGNASGWSF